MNKRIVLLTGASSGIGKELARQLAQRGDFPLLVARNMCSLHSLKKELGQCDIFSCDVTDQEQVQNLVDEIINEFGRVDVLINNAGYGRFGGILDISIEDYIGMIDTNYLGAVRLTRSLLPHMLEGGGGRIVNIASVAGLTGIPNLPGYVASKFALIGFSESLKLEYSPKIQVGVLCPGPVYTPFFGGEDPARLFPSPIARQLIDAQTVARHAVRLIDRPRIKVIPSTLNLFMKVRNLVPGFYMWMTKKIYDRFKEEQATWTEDSYRPVINSTER
ncbi:SDR family NAD(P)-dependent oxidoreductase [Paenactinomyces guangxiensis]|uniref:SDR family oxidoreductase n=1 Tax=Paenactinomyces guangxiensis TaxID=1490290 RepID=A0A7W2A991_9BACL|nr:SDR family oxidoreductase [Paenactinomyces guangxiensis]MBA4494974.1 SDR family oxidoreductase [Paenactinomyces guangxiensis]MBH8592057.1 SDR family oxidoreductase [Paenactinomyces guangxiensis]